LTDYANRSMTLASNDASSIPSRQSGGSQHGGRRLSCAERGSNWFQITHRVTCQCPRCFQRADPKRRVYSVFHALHLPFTARVLLFAGHHLQIYSVSRSKRGSRHKTPPQRQFRSEPLHAFRPIVGFTRQSPRVREMWQEFFIYLFYD
jgi:hypothetical protein